MSRFSKISLSREGGALAKYLEEIGQHHPLSSEEETELAERIRKGDRNARDLLVQANLRFVVSVAKEYQNQGMPLGDLICEGNVGLLKAAERFDGTRGFRFISYAVWWIRQSMLHALAEQSRIVRMPLNRVAKLYRIAKASRLLRQDMEQTPSLEEIAQRLDMSCQEVGEIITGERRHRSLDASVSTEDDEDSLFHLIRDESCSSPEEDVVDGSLQEQIEMVLRTLEPKEAEVLRLYYGIGQEKSFTLDEIGERYGLTREGSVASPKLPACASRYPTSCDQ